MKERKYPRVFKFKEKYGDYFYLVNSFEDLNKLWLQILTERHKEGYWYGWMEDYVPYSFKKLEYDEKTVNALPESMTEEKINMLKALKKELSVLAEQASCRQRYKAIIRAIEDKNGALAYKILSAQADGEYEGFEEIDLETIN